MDHEPCKSYGDCYHARGGRIAGRIAVESGQLVSVAAKGGRIQGRIQGRKNVESGHLASVAAKGARIAGRIAAESGQIASLGRIQGRKNVESGHISSLGRIQGRKNVASGQLASVSAKGGTKTAEIHRRQKPNRQEAAVAALLTTFYPDVWADTIWQRSLPNGLRGVPDLRHPIKVIGEYDGGGHPAFKDRSADDAAKDAERRSAGYIVIRETDPFILVIKFAYAVRAVTCLRR